MFKKFFLFLMLLLSWQTLQAQTINNLADVDNSGSIDILDALKTVQYSIGIPVSGFILERSDVNGDGVTNVVDGLMIAQFYVGIINSFPAADNIQTPTPVITPPPTYIPPSSGDDWLHVEGAVIKDMQGNPVWLTGTNWFGFNTGTNAFDGIWSANLEKALDGMAARGINLLRVPISTELLYNWSIGVYPLSSSINDYVNPNLKGKTSYDIFQITVAYCESIGMKILLDVHSADSAAMGHIDPLWYSSSITTEQFYSAWEWVARTYKDNDTIIAFDLENEPHGIPWQLGAGAAKWDTSTDPNNWKHVAEVAGKKILAINPNVLILVEGIEAYPKPGASYASKNSADYFTNWWGGNLRGVKDLPVNLGSGQSQLMYSPHDYGPMVFLQPWFYPGFNKETLYNDCWKENWFYIQEENIAPLLIGEWGGRMDGGDNQKWMEAMRDFIVEKKIHHTFWCYNANSGDTGGLVDHDFMTWDEAKYALMEPTLWKDRSGKYVGLDHARPLGSSATGTNITEYYRGGGTPPVAE